MRGPGLAGAATELNDFWRDHLVQLDAQSKPMREFLGDTPSGRLGLYYERLWHYLLQQDPDTDLLAHNLRVQDGKRTVGEFDCMLLVPAPRGPRAPGAGGKVLPRCARHRCLAGAGPARPVGPEAEPPDLTPEPPGHAPCGPIGPAPHWASSPALAWSISRAICLRHDETMPAPEYHNEDNPLRHWYTLSEFQQLPALPDNWAGWQEIPRRRWLSAYMVEDGAKRSR